ncbi:MAG: acyl-CoA thioesterase [Phycisphaerae bacterium]|nr:acyl-CoA thioesterase [Gemmatimonadaceae bacterium]
MPASSQPNISYERVRWSDVDLVGIMRFSAFTRLVEHGEQELWRQARLPYSEAMGNPEYWMPRRSLHIDYTAPARLDAPLALVTYVTRLGDSSLTFNVEVMSGDLTRLYALASVVTVCVSAGDFLKRTMPDELRTAMQPFTMSSDDVRAMLANPQQRAGYKGA